MKNFTAHFASAVLRFRFTVLFLSFLLFCGSLYYAQRVYFDNSNEMWFLEGDPALQDYRKLIRFFGDDEFLVLGFENADKSTLFQQKSLERIQKITEFLEAEEYVTKVQSLTKAEQIVGKEDTLSVEKLFPDGSFKLSPEELKQIEKRATGDTLLQNLVITKDGRFSMIIARTEHIPETIDFKVELVQKLKHYLAELPGADDFRMYISGGPALDEAFMSFSSYDQQRLIPLVLLLIFVVLLFLFRRASGVFMPLVVIGGTVLLVFGFIGFKGENLNFLNAILPIIILAIGIADAVHILAAHRRFCAKGMPSEKAAEETICHLFAPCFYTSLTTCIGFMAFSGSPIAPVKEFGMQAAVGVGGAFLLSVTLLPVLLSFSKPGMTAVSGLSRTFFLPSLFSFITGLQTKGIIITLAVFLFLTFSSLSAMRLVHVDANAMKYFKADSDIRIASEYIDGKVQGAFNIELIIDAGKKGEVKNPEVLRQIEELQHFLEDDPRFGKVISIVDFIKQMNKVMHNDDPLYYRLPETRREVAQYLLLYSLSSPDEDLSDMIDFSERYTRLSVRVPVLPTSEYKKLTGAITTFLHNELPRLQANMTGILVLFNNIDSYVIDTQIRSFTIAFSLIFLMMIFIFRSFSFGVLSMIPNLFPVCIAGGVMGLFGINLEFGTAMVACIVIGIAVDDSIHYLMRYQQKYKEGYPVRQALSLALEEAGEPIVFTSVILFFGFAVLLFASFNPNLYMGLLVCVGIIFALLADIFLLSALLLLLHRKKKDL